MIDLHSHMNFGVDDGAFDVDEAVEMAQDAYELGYRKVVCTSHVRLPQYTCERYMENFDLLKKELKNRGVKVEIIPGNELFLDFEGMEQLREGKVNTLGNSSYVLVESFYTVPYTAFAGAVAEIKEMGYNPVIAHVERYSFTLPQIRELHREYPIQINISSLTGSKKRKVEILLEDGLVDILGSDSHRGCRHKNSRRNYALQRELEIYRKMLGEERFRILTEINPERILKDEKVMDSRTGIHYRLPSKKRSAPMGFLKKLKLRLF